MRYCDRFYHEMGEDLVEGIFDSVAALQTTGQVRDCFILSAFDTSLLSRKDISILFRVYANL
jgi:hypothetical protein